MVSSLAKNRDDCYRNSMRNILVILFVFCITSTSVLAQSNSNYDIFALSDIHFDPFLTCENKRPCVLFEKLRDTSPQEWPKIFDQYGIRPQPYKKDTSYVLLTEVLKYAKQIAEKNNAQVALVLGDSLAHEFRKNYHYYNQSEAGYDAFVHKTLLFLNQQLKATFPHLSIYMVVGNNDSYQGNYAINLKNSFYRETAILWSGLIQSPNDQKRMQQSFSWAGYYSIMLSDKLRLIVMNSVLFSYKAKGVNLNKAAMEELNWLHVQLKAAQANKENVLIAAHIPQGIDLYFGLRTFLVRIFKLWKSEYIDRFEAELKQFFPEIKGIFLGHLHANWMQILSNKENEIPEVGVTSISPYFGNDPGFAVISFTDNPFTLKQVTTYDYSINYKEWENRSIKVSH